MIIMIIIFITFVFVALLSLLIIFITLLTIRDNLIHDVPFIPIKKRCLKNVIDALSLTSGDILIDLGSGDGRVLVEAVRHTGGVFGIGVENALVPYLLSLLKTHGLPIKIKFENIMNTDISEATHVFCYLSPSFLKKVEPKIFSECRKGTKVFSCDYGFVNVSSIKTISIGREGDILMKEIFVYEV